MQRSNIENKKSTNKNLEPGLEKNNYVTLSFDELKEKDNAESKFEMAYRLMYGIVVEQNTRKAQKYFKEALNAGHPVAYGLSLLLKNKISEGVQILKESATRGHPIAQYILFAHYGGELRFQRGYKLLDISIEIDHENQLFYLEKAVNSQQIQALYAVMMFNMVNISDTNQKYYENAITCFKRIPLYAKKDIHAKLAFFFAKNFDFARENSIEVSRDNPTKIDSVDDRSETPNNKIIRFTQQTYGINEKRNSDEAIILLFEAALKNIPLAVILFIIKSIKFTKNPEDMKNAILWLERFPDHQEACFYLADCYAQGLYVEKNIAYSIDLLQRAAGKNHPAALFYLAEKFEHGIEGVCEKDPQKAFDLYKKAANLGNSDAQFKLSILYLKAIPTEKDLEKRKSNEIKSGEYYQKALEYNHPEAIQCSTKYPSLMDYILHSIQPKPALEDNKYNRWSAEDLEKEIYTPELLLRKGSSLFYRKNIPQDIKNVGWNLMLHAAYLGHPTALGLCFLELGVFDRTIQLLSQSAERGYAFAQYKLASCFLLGLGVPINYGKAALCIKRAEENGFEINSNEFTILLKNFTLEMQKNIHYLGNTHKPLLTKDLENLKNKDVQQKLFELALEMHPIALAICIQEKIYFEFDHNNTLLYTIIISKFHTDPSLIFFASLKKEIEKNNTEKTNEKKIEKKRPTKPIENLRIKNEPPEEEKKDIIKDIFENFAKKNELNLALEKHKFVFTIKEGYQKNILEQLCNVLKNFCYPIQVELSNKNAQLVVTYLENKKNVVENKVRSNQKKIEEIFNKNQKKSLVSNDGILTNSTSLKISEADIKSILSYLSKITKTSFSTTIKNEHTVEFSTPRSQELTSLIEQIRSHLKKLCDMTIDITTDFIIITYKNGDLNWEPVLNITNEFWEHKKEKEKNKKPLSKNTKHINKNNKLPPEEGRQERVKEPEIRIETLYDFFNKILPENVNLPQNAIEQQRKKIYKFKKNINSIHWENHKPIESATLIKALQNIAPDLFISVNFELMTFSFNTKEFMSILNNPISCERIREELTKVLSKKHHHPVVFFNPEQKKHPAHNKISQFLHESESFVYKKELRCMLDFLIKLDPQKMNEDQNFIFYKTYYIYYFNMINLFYSALSGNSGPEIIKNLRHFMRHNADKIYLDLFYEHTYKTIQNLQACFNGKNDVALSYFIFDLENAYKEITKHQDQVSHQMTFNYCCAELKEAIKNTDLDTRFKSAYLLYLSSVIWHLVKIFIRENVNYDLEGISQDVIQQYSISLGHYFEMTSPDGCQSFKLLLDKTQEKSSDLLKPQ